MLSAPFQIINHTLCLYNSKDVTFFHDVVIKYWKLDNREECIKDYLDFYNKILRFIVKNFHQSFIHKHFQKNIVKL